VWVIVHMLTGLALGSALGGPWWFLFPLALVAHVVIDLIPHWDYTRTRYRVFLGVLDVAVSALACLLCYVVLRLPSVAVLAGILSAAPDLDVLSAILPYEQQRRWFPSHWSRFPHGKAGPTLGIIIQCVMIVVSVATILLTKG
jgi:hypothetical protein